MWFHLAYWSWAEPAGSVAALVRGSVAYPQLGPFAWFGWVGVETFFVISGFVIAFSAEGKRPAEFLKSRFLRLFPAVWIIAPITIAILALTGTPLHNGGRAAAFARTVTLFPYGQWVSGVYWTLGVEMVFYAFVLAILLLNQFERFERYLWALALPSLIAWSYFTLAHTGLIGGDLLPILESRNAQLLMLRYGSQFALGGMLYIAAARGFSRGRIAAMLVFACGGAVEVYAMAVDRAAVAHSSAWIPVVVWLSSVACIYLAIRFNGEIHRALSDRAGWIRKVGLATFPLYLIHSELGGAALRLLRGLGLTPMSSLILAICLCVAAGFALLVPEKHLRRLLASLLAYPRPRWVAVPLS